MSTLSPPLKAMATTKGRKSVLGRRKHTTAERALWLTNQKLLGAAERIGYENVPAWLDSHLLAIEEACLNFDRELQIARFVPTSEAIEVLGVGNSFLIEQADSGHLLLGTHYLIASDGDAERILRLWNVEAIKLLWATHPAHRPLPKKAVKHV